VVSIYQSIGLTRQEVANFCADFYSLELAKIVNVKIDPTSNYVGFYINLRSPNTFSDLLDASFRDGNLSQKWGKKFKKL